MPGSAIRILLVADTHLGYDWPLRPRVQRRRRGADFFANFERALEPALVGEIDLVVHGGDLLFRSRVRRELVVRAFEPLKRVADTGVPVLLVPGNHERSQIPFPLLGAHPGIQVFRRPTTFSLEVAGKTLAAAGFPCIRTGARDRFPELLEQTGWPDLPCDARILCLHQTVEGARVGPRGYTFRRGADVVRAQDLPTGFAAVLSGHIHRHQVLTTDLAGRALPAPVLYPGSVERTSRAERDEPKGFMTLLLRPTAGEGELVDWRFHPLPARPMIDLELRPTATERDAVERQVREKLASLPPDAVVRFHLTGPHALAASEWISAATLRSLAPETMNIDLLPQRPRS